MIHGFEWYYRGDMIGKNAHTQRVPYRLSYAYNWPDFLNPGVNFWLLDACWARGALGQAANFNCRIFFFLLVSSRPQITHKLGISWPKDSISVGSRESSVEYWQYGELKQITIIFFYRTKQETKQKPAAKVICSFGNTVVLYNNTSPTSAVLTLLFQALMATVLRFQGPSKKRGLRTPNYKPSYEVATMF